ncbi:MAG: hypothetical protein ACLSB9_21390 [Hydrogeniiclostridium mannosilyticum]
MRDIVSWKRTPGMVYGSFVPDLLEVFNGFEELDGFIKPFEKTPDKRRMVEVERTVGQYTGLTDGTA